MSEYSKKILSMYIDKTGGLDDLPPPTPPTFPPSGGAGGDGKSESDLIHNQYSNLVPSSFTVMPMFHAQPLLHQQEPQYPPPTSMGNITQPSLPPVVAFPGTQQPMPPSQSLYPRPTVK